MRLHVLLIEDSVVQSMAMIRLLESYNLKITITHKDTLSSALKELGSDKIDNIDIILSDLNLPDSSGAGTIEKIYEKTKKYNIPIVVITSLTDDETVKSCIRVGANRFFNKYDGNGNLRRAIIASMTKSEMVREKEEVLLSVMKNIFEKV